VRDVLTELEGFHRNIRAALQALHDVAKAAARGDVDRVKVCALYDFFIGPLHWHDIDERESLLPRLAPHAHARVFHIVADDHAAIEAACEDVLAHLHDVAAGTAVPDAQRLAAADQRLHDLVVPHLAREETHIYPLARATLSPDALRSIAAEVNVRRMRRMSSSLAKLDRIAS
jgi:hemerythrin-like domain-containing protein